MGAFQQYRNLYETKGSDVTSQVMFVGDASTVALTLIASASTTSLQLSNADGFGAAIPENTWSTASVIVNPGPAAISVEAGHRWLRTQRTSAVTALLALSHLR